MAEDNPLTVGKRFLGLTATLSVVVLVLLLSTMPTSGSAEQRAIITGNSSLCSSVNSDSGYLAIVRAQPELEGFEMTADLGSGVVPHRSLLPLRYPSKTGGAGNRNRAVCRDKPNGPYKSCTTIARSGSPPGQKCSDFTRGC